MYNYGEHQFEKCLSNQKKGVYDLVHFLTVKN